MRDIPLGGTPAVTLHIAADTPVALNMSAETEAHYRRLVREAAALFGATHYNHYEFLWALTDQIMPDGLEHHQSSDDRSPLRACWTTRSGAPRRISCRTNMCIPGTANIAGRRGLPRPIIRNRCSTTCSGSTRD